MFTYITAHLRAHVFSKAGVIVFCISFAQINLKFQTHLYAPRASPLHEDLSMCVYLIFLFKRLLFSFSLRNELFNPTTIAELLVLYGE